MLQKVILVGRNQVGFCCSNWNPRSERSRLELRIGVTAGAVSPWWQKEILSILQSLYSFPFLLFLFVTILLVAVWPSLNMLHYKLWWFKLHHAHYINPHIIILYISLFYELVIWIMPSAEVNYAQVWIGACCFFRFCNYLFFSSFI